MSHTYLKTAFVLASLSLAASAQATQYVVFDSQNDGRADFTSTVTAAGGTTSIQQLVGGQTSYADFTVSRNPSSGYSGIQGGVASWTAPAAGLTFDFGAKKINALGFDVGDWGTCCQPSALYISFDDGAPILLGTSTTPGDVYLTNGRPVIFVGAFDDSSSFSKVTFYGTGNGDQLNAGGRVHYALLDQGSLSVPEPATWAMMIAGFGAVGGSMRRRAAQTKVSFA